MRTMEYDILSQRLDFLKTYLRRKVSHLTSKLCNVVHSGTQEHIVTLFCLY